MTQPLDDLVGSIVTPDAEAAAAARDHQLQLTKPPGSLGRIEDLGVQLAAIAGAAIPPMPEPAAVVVFAADHGVHAEGVSPWPQEVTAQMVANFCAGGAAINVIGSLAGAEVTVVNAGVAEPLADHPKLINEPVRHGTANLRVEAAMSRDEAGQALLLGARTALRLISSGAACLITGDMGIANTTASAALIAALTGGDPSAVTGRGSGIDDATLALKQVVIEDALRRVPLDALRSDPVGLVSELGGLEIAALGGFCLAGAAVRVPVIVDGVIALAGALVAHALQPLVTGYLIAGHRSVEPGARAALDHLGLDPLLDLGLRLGEGSGAALAYPLVRAAAALMRDMATFGDAGVTDTDAGR